MIRLSNFERLLLANQYDILGKLAPESADDYGRLAEALRDGYEMAYQDVFNHIFDPLDIEECRLVVKTMAMYDALQRSFDALEDKAGIDEWRIGFPGFDGNNETSYMGYARFIVEEENRFTNLRAAGDFNSHMPMVEEYRRMLSVWEGELAQSYAMSRDQILRLFSRQ